jgi:hypothetical protein
LIFVC